MAHELDGKVTIVTGGAKGIGAAIAEVFAEEGARVVVADVDADNGEALAARLGGTVRFRRTDVAQKAEVEALVAYALSEFGGLHAMVNNAAITGNFHNRFLDDPIEDFDTVLRVNLASVMYGSKAAAVHMAKAGGGSIINTTSISAQTPGYALMAYRASKAGVITFTRSIAVDLGEYNIRCNCLSPGHIPTGLNHFADQGLSPEKQAALQEVLAPLWFVDQPLKRQGSPRDCGNAALYLASDRSAQVTGQVLAVDGGITAGNPINLNKMLTDARTAFLASS